MLAVVTGMEGRHELSNKLEGETNEAKVATVSGVLAGAEHAVPRNRDRERNWHGLGLGAVTRIP